MLDDPLIWRSLAQACLGMALWAAIGVGLGALLRNQVAAVVVIIAFSQLVEPLARFGLNAWSATRDIAQFLPGAAADAMAGASLYNIGAAAPQIRRTVLPAQRLHHPPTRRHVAIRCLQ